LTTASHDWEALRHRAITDFRFFCSSFLKIKPKPPENEDDDDDDLPALIPFVFNPAQEIVYGIMQRQLREIGRVELTVLKARQFGLSTFFIAWAFWKIFRQAETSAGIAVPHGNKILLGEFFNTANTFYMNLPEVMRPPLRGPLGKKQNLNKADIHFAPPHNSRLLGAVESPHGFRGYQFDMLHLSECAFYKNPEDFIAGVMPAFNKKRKGSTRVFESTPAEGWFQDQYDAAKEEGTAIFLPWYVNRDQYALPVKKRGTAYYNERGKQIQFTREELDEREAIDREIIQYNEEYGLTDKDAVPPLSVEQLYWRQERLQSKDYLGDVERFNREFPRDEQSAFLYGTHGHFAVCMNAVNLSVRKSYEAGALESTTYKNPASPKQKIAFKSEHTTGYIDQERREGWYIWEHPQPEYTYGIGVDVAGEYDYDTDDRDRGAYSVICVYNLEQRVQVAEWRGSIDPFDLGDETVKAGYYYNLAIVCVEANNQGWSTKARIERNLMYPNVYEWKDMDTNAPTKKTMWVTNVESKEMMIDAFKNAVRKGYFKVTSEGLKNEMATYMHKRGVGYTGGTNTSDRIIAASLAFQAALDQPLGINIILDSLNSSTDSHNVLVDTLDAAYMLDNNIPPASRMPPHFYDENAEHMEVEDNIYALLGIE